MVSRDLDWRSLNKESFDLIKSETKRKFSVARARPRVVAKLLAELLLSVAIGFAILLYLDPAINWIPAPWNFALFALLIALLLIIKYVLP